MIRRYVPEGLWNRLGRRGIVLALFGLAWVIQGLGTFALHTPVPTPSSEVWHQNIPWQVMGSLWLFGGFLSIAFATRHRKQSDTIGFLAVSLVPMFLAGSYLVSFLTWMFTWGDQGWPIGFIGFAIWGVVVTALAVIASWPEPEEENACE